MTKEEAIKYLRQLYPNGGHCWLDEQRIEAIGMAINALQEESVSEDLEKEISNNWETGYELGIGFSQYADVAHHFANWQKNQIMKDAVETIIDSKPNDYGEFIPIIHVKLDSSYKEGEKVKLIIVKEE